MGKAKAPKECPPPPAPLAGTLADVFGCACTPGRFFFLLSALCCPCFSWIRSRTPMIHSLWHCTARNGETEVKTDQGKPKGCTRPTSQAHPGDIDAPGSDFHHPSGRSETRTFLFSCCCCCCCCCWCTRFLVLSGMIDHHTSWWRAV